jgi:KDO2-lipid IV(A) lauroyltransferase
LPERGLLLLRVRDEIRMTMWDNLGRVVAEYSHLEKFKATGDDPRITVSFLPGLSADDMKGHALMFLSAHLGNWEMLPIVGEELGIGGAAVVRPPNNPYVADWVARQRSINGPGTLIAKHNAARQMLTQLRGQKVLYMLVDQKLREGIAVPFFGRDAPTTPAPTTAMRSAGPGAPSHSALSAVSMLAASTARCGGTWAGTSTTAFAGTVNTSW